MKGKKQKLPNCIDIFNYKYKVIINEDIARHGREGETDCERQTIKISPTVTNGRAIADVLLHEIIHAVCHTGLEGDDNLEENQVLFLAMGLSEVFFRNPELKKILFP